MDGQAGGVEGLEELDERLAHPLGVGESGDRVARCRVRVARHAGFAVPLDSGVGEGFEDGREAGRGGIGDAGGDAGGAVTEAAHREAGLLGGVGFEVGQPGGLSGFGEVGGDDVEDASPDAGELLRPELACVVDEVLLCQCDGLGVHGRGQRTECSLDHPGLRQRCRAVAHRRRQGGPVAVQCLGQAQVGACVGVRGAGVLRQPAGSITGGRRLSQITGVGEDPQPQLGQLRLRSRELDQRARLLTRRHERRVRVGDAFE